MELFQWQIPLIVLLFIGLDILCGLIQATMNNAVDSTKMRDGLYHKSGYVLVMLLAYLIEFGTHYLELGFSAPVVIPVAVFICLTELVSILENCCKISPALANSKIFSIFNVDKIKEECNNGNTGTN